MFAAQVIILDAAYTDENLLHATEIIISSEEPAGGRMAVRAGGKSIECTNVWESIKAFRTVGASWEGMRRMGSRR